MYFRKLALIVCVLAVALMPQGSKAASAPEPPPITYRVVLKEIQARTLHIICQLPQAKKGTLRLSFPSWSPGFYKYRPIRRYILNLKAYDGERELAVNGALFDTYEVENDRPGRLRIEYDIDLSAKNQQHDKSFIGDDLALIKGDFTFCSVEGYRDAPVRVEIDGPPGWPLVTSLKETSGGAFEAKDYDELIDGIIMLGQFKTESVRSGTAEFVLAVDRKLDVAPSQLAPIVKRLADYQISLFGKAPFSRYTFFIHVIPETYFNLFPAGVFGLEHRNSSTISFTPQGPSLMKGDHLNYVLEKLLAHELFHSWNGKHIVPAELYEPDLSQVVKSPNIWFVEGVTTYYEALSVYRAGEHKRQTFYSLITSFIQDGNVTESLEQMSVDSWKGLNPILYTKGALVALALDLKIRWATNNARSLDDVMRQMHDQLATNSKQFTAESLRRFISKVAGENLDEFFARYVTGSERLDVDAVLSQAGLKLGSGKRKLAQDVGIFFNSNNSEVVALLPNGAGEAAGLRPKDKILAIDSISLQTRPLDKAIADYDVGSSYELQVLRGDEKLMLKMTINAIEETFIRVVENEQATDKQIKIREGLLSRPLRHESSRVSARSHTGAALLGRLLRVPARVAYAN